MTGSITHTQKKYGMRSRARGFPLMCVIAMSYVCNSRCPNCPYTNSDIRSTYNDRPFMPDEVFYRIADQCGPHKSWIRITGGGEPLLHPRALELIAYAKKARAKVGLITNGALVSARVARRLLACGLDAIEFSVDAGCAATYRRVRRGLDWNRLVRNVRGMVRLRDEMKARTRIIVSAINQVGVDVDAVTRFWGGIADNVQIRKYLTWGITDPGKSANPAPYLTPGENIPCPFIFERMNIDTRGNVMLCGFDIAGKTNLGNVLKRSIAEIWRGKEFGYYRKMHLGRRGNRIALCKRCPDWQYRSWRHNYWKLLRNAGHNLRSKRTQPVRR